MRAAQQSGVLEVVRCETRPSSRVRARALLLNILFAVVTNVTSTRFKADKGIMDALVHPRKKRSGGRGEETAGESVLAAPLWGILHAEDAGVVSESPEQPRKMMGVIVVVCAAFGFTISEVKPEIMCLRAKRMAESTATFSVEAAGQVYNQTSRSTGAYATHGAASGTVRQTERSPRAQNPDSQSRRTRHCCTAASRGAHARATTTRCTEPTTGS